MESINIKTSYNDCKALYLPALVTLANYIQFA